MRKLRIRSLLCHPPRGDRFHLHGTLQQQHEAYIIIAGNICRNVVCLLFYVFLLYVPNVTSRLWAEQNPSRWSCLASVRHLVSLSLLWFLLFLKILHSLDKRLRRFHHVECVQPSTSKGSRLLILAVATLLRMDCTGGRLLLYKLHLPMRQCSTPANNILLLAS